MKAPALRHQNPPQIQEVMHRVLHKANIPFDFCVCYFFLSAALQVLNIIVVTLSGFGLVSTCLLIYGLIQVSRQLNSVHEL